MDQVELTKAFGTIFAIMNPFTNLPLFLALTTGLSVAEQRTLAVKITVFSAIMCAVILLAGQAIISFFGITVDQFKIAGGAVLASIAWSMLHGESIAPHEGSDEEKGHLRDLSGLAFYPLTFPMIVGPGTIAALIVSSGHAADAGSLGAIGAIVAVILAILFVVLFFAAQIGKLLSDTMRVITTRLMSMILLAISVEMIVAGLIVLLPGLAAAGS